VVELAEAKKGFVLRPKRWVVERSFVWVARFRRLVKDYERLSDVIRELQFLVFAILMLPKATPLLTATGNA
jgi:transposase